MGHLISCHRKTLRRCVMSDRYINISVLEHYAASIFRKEVIYCRFLLKVRAVCQRYDVTSQETAVLTIIAVCTPSVASIFKHFRWI
jgi:hypothetical protein